MRRRIERFEIDRDGDGVMETHYRVVFFRRSRDEDDPTRVEENVHTQDDFSTVQLDDKIDFHRQKMRRFQRVKTRIEAMEAANEETSEDVD